MAFDIPDTPDIETKIYENFKGVDYTNDPTNVWYRRSPSGVNMLPDASGRPFKRHGWEIKISASTLAEKYATDTGETAPEEVQINKLYYLELHGLDHIFIFTNIGLFIYRKTEDGDEYLDTSATYSYNDDIIESYERAYFFEGNGEAAFYIYGNFTAWVYKWTDEGFVFGVDDPYKPTVNIAVDARHESGTSYEDVNLFSGYIKERFQNNAYYSAVLTTTGTGFTATVSDESTLTGYVTTTSTFTYTDGEWKLGGDAVQIKDYGITVSGQPSDEATIVATITRTNKIMLPKSFQSSTGMSVKASTSTQFDTTLTFTTGTPTANQVKLDEDELIFGSEWNQIVEGEDCIELTMPRDTMTATSYTASATVTLTAGE